MYFAMVGGKQIPLGVTEKEKFQEAADKLAEHKAKCRERLLARACEIPAAPVQTVSSLATAFLERKEGKVGPECYRQYRITLEVHFLPVFGTRQLASLTSEEIEDWADRPAWSSSTRNNNLGTIQTFLKWAKRPLSIKRPPKESRGADSVLSDDDFEKLISGTSGDYGSDFVALLRVLRETGARPQEIARLTIDMVDWDNACARLKQHKTRRHGAERIIHFNSAVMTLLKSQRRTHKTGYLFRTRKGNPWRCDAIVKRMVQLSERSGVKATAYGLGRHSFATKALVRGVPDAVVAELLGHRGTSMVSKHYGHVGGQSRVLKDAVEMMSKPKAG